jgi:hypothetical protein
MITIHNTKCTWPQIKTVERDIDQSGRRYWPCSHCLATRLCAPLLCFFSLVFTTIFLAFYDRKRAPIYGMGPDVLLKLVNCASCNDWGRVVMTGIDIVLPDEQMTGGLCIPGMAVLIRNLICRHVPVSRDGQDV